MDTESIWSDIDTVDNLLGDALRMFMGTFSSILGAIILISIVLPWFLIGVFVILLGYIWAAAFYRASARELKVPMPQHPSICSVLISFRFSAPGRSPSFLPILPFLGKLVWIGDYSGIQRVRPLPPR